MRERSFVKLGSLGTRYASSVRAFVSLSDFESDIVANFQFVKGNANQFLGVEEQILLFAIARDESESSVRKGLDDSVHIDSITIA